MRSLMPWRGMPSLRQEMDRLFDRFFEPEWGEFPTALGEWVPSLDLSETKDAFVVKVEIPGMDPKDMQVSLQENSVPVKAEKVTAAGERLAHTAPVREPAFAFAS